jgi:hypothetical protein
MTVVVALSTADGTAVNATLTATGGNVLTKIDERAATNMRVAVYVGTGLLAGETITPSGAAKSAYWSHFYTDVFTLNGGSLSAAVRPGSQATTTTGSVTPDAGQPVLVVAAERTTLDGTTVSSVTSSGGETVTQIAYSEDAATTDSSMYFGVFTASAAAARTATITYSSGSGNGYAAAIIGSSGGAGGAVYAAAAA